MILAFDIETIPDLEAVELMPEPEVKTGNLKDPAKIAEKVAEAKAEQAKKAALNPLTARVVAAGFSGEDFRCCKCLIPTPQPDRFGMDFHEQDLIEWVFTRLATPDLRIVTFNGHGFDLPMIYRRALILGIDPAQFSAPPITAWNRGRYTTERHTDLQQVWNGGNSEPQKGVSLSSLSGIILHRKKIDLDVTTIPALLETDEGRSAVAKYCIADCDLTMDLFERFNGTLIA